MQQSNETTQILSLIIPVYNEADHLARFLSEIDALSLAINKELIIVNDYSSDSSKEIIDNFAFKSSVQILHKDRNEGKGAAIRSGIELANGTLIGIQDADFEYDYNDISLLLEPLIQGRADIVFGSRFKQGANQVHRTFHYLVNRFLTLFSNLVGGLYLTDMETCYKFFRAEILKNIILESNRFGFEPEITAKIARLKIRMMELPISYFPRTYIEGKKITWQDGIAALRHILVFNLFRNNSQCFKDTMPDKFIPKGWNIL